jgi:hypothetical protein
MAGLFSLVQRLRGRTAGQPSWVGSSYALKHYIRLERLTMANTLDNILNSPLTATVKSFITLATGARGRIQTLDLRFIRPVVYHFANQRP